MRQQNADCLGDSHAPLSGRSLLAGCIGDPGPKTPHEQEQNSVRVSDLLNCRQLCSSSISPHIANFVTLMVILESKRVHQGDVTQELLTRLAPLPLTSLGVREVSLAQPEEAEGLGSVEVVLKITSLLMIVMIIMMVMLVIHRWPFSPWPVSSFLAPSLPSSVSAASR